MASSLRVVTLNFWGTEPPLDRRIALAVRQLAVLAPDVVCLQEVSPVGGGKTTADRIAEPLGLHAHYGRACTWEAGVWGPGTPAGELQGSLQMA